MLKKILLGAGMSLAFVLISAIGLKQSENNKDVKIDTQNIAGTYTEIVDGDYHIDWSTGMMGCDTKYKDVYTTTTSTIIDSYDGKWQFVDGWNGPREMVRDETITHGAERKTSFGGGVEARVFKITASHDITESSSNSTTLKFIFPGDMTTWNLYVTRRNINKIGYTRRTSYISELCYKYIWGIACWDTYWSSYTRYPARDFSATQACDTVENQYGHQMIQE